MRWLLVAAVAACEPLAAPAPPRAADLLDQARHTYATARSYEDRGTVRVSRMNGPVSDDLSFETAFVRGGKFRFTYRRARQSETYVLWFDGAHAYTLWSLGSRAVTEARDLGLEIGAATGVSGGTVSTVPLLMPDLQSIPSVLSLAEPRLVGQKAIEGHACWRVDGTFGSRSTTLWLDVETHVLRRLYERIHVAKTRSQPASDYDWTMSYEPAINLGVADEHLRRPDPGELPPPPTFVEQQRPGIGVILRMPEVIGLTPGGPAERAGLRVGDEIESIDGSDGISDGLARVARSQAGSQHSLVVFREGKELTFEVSVELMTFKVAP